MISTDSKIFEKNSAVRARMIEYGVLVEHLDIIVLSKNKTKQDILSPNVTAYSTCSGSRFSALFLAIQMGKHFSGVNLVTAQDPFETGFAGWRIARSLGARLELQVHTDFMSPYFATENIKNKIRVMIAKFLLPKAQCVRVVSERIKKSIAGLTNASVTVLPIFTDIKKIQDADGSHIRAQFPQFEKIVLVVSRLEHEKNVAQAIGVFAKTVKKYPKAGLLIVGDGSERKNLKSQISNLKLEDRVILVGVQNTVASYYVAADVYLHTSFYEGYGLALLEAYAVGLSIVTTDVGVVGGVVSGEGISVCSVGDEDCLVSALTSALSNPRRLIRKLTQTSKEEYLLAYKKQWELCSSRV